MNNLKATGTYICVNASTNKPTNTGGALFVIRADTESASANGAQLLLDYNGRLWMRALTGGAWSNWSEH